MTVLAATVAANTTPLRSCCDNANLYPLNLAPRLGNTICLQEKQERLENDNSRLFRSTQGYIHINEVLSGRHKCCAPVAGENNVLSGCLVLNQRPQSSAVACVQPYHGPCVQSLGFGEIDELKQHLEYPLDHRLKDAASRHVFIHAKSNKSALLCSASMFKYLCSYHEVSPNFLKLVHGLGNQLSPKAPRSLHFGGLFEELHTIDDEDLQSPDPPDENSMPLVPGAEGPLRLNWFKHSGKEMRNYYQLNGMEIGTAEKFGKRGWSMRQTTVYHSFDLEHARQFWITIKANSQIKERFEDHHSSTALGRPGKAEELQDLHHAFSSSLTSQLIHLNWCVEGWGRYIDDREIKIREIIDRIEAAPVTFNQAESIVRQRSGYDKSQVNLRSGTFRSLVSRASRRTTLENSQSNKSFASPRQNSFGLNWPRHNVLDEEKAEADTTQDQPIWHQAAIANVETKDLTKRFMETEEIFKDFSIDGTQNITAFCTGLQDTKLAITSNMRVLEGLRTSYQSFMESEECPEKIQKSCQRHMRQFVRRVNSLSTELKGEFDRVESLISQLQDAKPLYESILQFRNLKANEVMASHSRYASLRMEAVGERTERLTSSMHVITTFTLLLLPGTFLGSLFSTDIISRGDAGLKLDSVLGQLFLEICLPMMAISLIAWGIYMYLQRRRSQGRKDDISLIEKGMQDEKHKLLTQ